MPYIVSTDTGGTFVDAVVLDEAGTASFGKAPASPDDPARGLLAAVEAAARARGTDCATVLADCRLFLNGTTVTTNAMLQRRGARTGLLITAGFEDTLLIGRVMARTVGLSERELTSPQTADRPPPLAPITLTRGVRERVDYQGRILCPLDLDEVATQVDALVAAGIDALAVCLLWAFRNPAHERAIRDLVRTRYPWLYVVCSSDLVPVIGEYERANTTVVNAFLGPTLDSYLGRLEEALTARGYRGELLIMQSLGGLAPAREVRRVPVATLLSGPVGGVIAAARLGRLLDLPNVITTDMGGTSFDVGLVVDGEAQSRAVTVIQRQTVMFPCVDVITIGAGGGSIAWIDPAFALQVGPQSQGAVPGPACYGRGGTLPTVTDADVVLGYINPAYFVGGTMPLDAEAARAALRQGVAEPLGLGLEEAAEGVYTVVNAHMADLIRKASVERGYDPREFALFAFGGCGPTHCTAYGPDVGVRQIVVPEAETVFSAVGIAQADLRHTYAQSCPLVVPPTLEVAEERLQELNQVFDELLARARAQLARDGVAPDAMVLVRSVEMRYRHQIHELVVPLASAGALDRAALAALVAEFRQRYERRYGAGAAPERTPYEVLNLRVDAVATSGFTWRLAPHPLGPADPAPARVGERAVWWPSLGRRHPTPIYRRDRLAPGNTLVGPAVVEMYGSTLPLPPGQRCTVDAWRNLIVTAA